MAWAKWVLFVGLALSQGGCALMHLHDPPPPPEVVLISEAKAAHEAASMSRAYFLDQLRSRKGERFRVRAYIPCGNDEAELLWLNNPVLRGDRIRGNLSERPIVLRGVPRGGVVETGTDMIADWVIVRNGRTYGGFTGKAP
ncbi:MAG: DUF2314 domain-containing protein [Fimbriimonadaceae bacterium]|nr:DUF2314 domain-containing protein [Fimbriimonadaceae bacterium]